MQTYRYRGSEQSGSKQESDRSRDFKKDVRVFQRVSTGGLDFSKRDWKAAFKRSSEMW